MRLFVTGSIAIDYIMRFPGLFEEHILPDRLNSLSVSFLVDRMRQSYGGVGGNIAYTLALLGEKPVLVGSVGGDFGPYRQRLKDVGVDTSGVLVKPDDFTASFFVSTDQRGNQIAFFYMGAMNYADEIDLAAVGVQAGDVVVVSPDKPAAMCLHAHQAKELGARLVFDPSQQIPLLSGDDLRETATGAYALTLNDYEFALFKGKTGMSDEDIRRSVEVVLVTKGEAGSELWTQGDVVRVTCAAPREVVDPTGAGDAYRAGLIKGLAHGLEWNTCGRVGAMAACYALEHSGTQEHRFTIEEFVARFTDAFGEDSSVRECMARELER